MTKIKTFSPLPDCVTIKPSEIDGLGLFATESIPAHTELGITHVRDDEAKDGLVRTALGSFINHSYNPNVKIFDDKKEWVLATVKEIKKGDEITVDYTPWYDVEILKTYK